MTNLKALFCRQTGWPEVENILKKLHEAGFKAYLAGGCVRDALLGKQAKDFDIASSARPEQVKKLFPNSNEQGKAFGVAAVFCKNTVVEVACFRKEGPYLDGRRPESVEFTDEKEDALRRDFTINALFYDVQKQTVVDYAGGLKDLKNKIIRTVGQPAERFKEDHLRILRALRFQIQLDFDIDKPTEEALYEMKDLLGKISKERVYEECLKILKANKFAKALLAFRKLALLKPFWRFTAGAPEDWKRHLTFTARPAPSSFLQCKSFLWLNVFYPLLCRHKEQVLTKEGKWKKDFSTGLQNEKLPRAVIKDMNTLFYHSLCLLDILPKSAPGAFVKSRWEKAGPKGQKMKSTRPAEKTSLAEKLKILNSPLADITLHLSEKYLQVNKMSARPLSFIKKEFKSRLINKKLSPPLVNGRILKALGVKEGREMADTLELLYNYQLEQKITSKEQLLKKFSLL